MTRSGAGIPYKLDLSGSFTSENTVSRFFFFSQRDWVCRKIVDVPRVLLILGPGAKSALCRISGINSRQRGINFFFFLPTLFLHDPFVRGFLKKGLIA